jgi:hypothetical protein
MATTTQAKTRRLKKYEADDSVCIRDDAQPPMDFLSPFGPMIARTRFPDELVARLNNHADGRIAADKSTEFLLPETMVFGGDPSVAALVAACIRRYVAALEDVPPQAPAEKIDFESFWVVSQYAGTPSPVHFHSSDISGVLYLKEPEIDEAEEAKTYLSGRRAGYINFIIGGKQRFSKSLISFRPRAGDFYVFPGWLLHGAEPFCGSGERRSMAFNANVGAAPR